MSETVYRVVCPDGHASRVFYTLGAAEDDRRECDDGHDTKLCGPGSHRIVVQGASLDLITASRILNMELLGLTPDDFEAEACTIAEYDDSLWPVEDDRGQDHLLTIAFDAQTDLEVELIVSAITEFVKRRTTAEHLRVEFS